MRKKLNSFIENYQQYEYKFGDFILFQEYQPGSGSYKVSKPVYAIFLGTFIADQTIGFNYVRWTNENRYELVSNEHFINQKRYNQVGDIEQHIEWSDYIDILGYWKSRPNWKDLLAAYRKMNHSEVEEKIS